ncbi:MAG TPA: sensor histidine kinase [Ktedonobacterales bacterium]|nr:sensor histidine kinase [Ktedonobacterales bacterium]
MTWLASMLILASNFGLDSFGSDDIPAPPHQAPWNALIFSGLMLLHAYLHWFALSGPRWRTWYPLYALAQGILVCVICVIVVIVPKVGNGLFLPLSLLLALVVEAAALLERARPVMLAALWYVALFVIYAMREYRSALDALFLSKRMMASQLGWVLLVIVPLILFVWGHVMTYTRQARAYERTQKLVRELEVAHAQIADYASRVEDSARMAERQRLARELHDTLAQGVTGLIMQLEVVDSHLTLSNLPRAQEIVHMAMTSARETLVTARGAIHDLRVESALPSDLTVAVGEEAQRFTAATGIPCDCDVAALSDVPLALRETIVRLIGEGLANIARHAHAQQASIQAVKRERRLIVEVCDDGVGFTPTLAAGRSGHYGLLGLSERAQLVGGALQALSTPGQGTTLRFSAPLHTPAQAVAM